MSVAKQPFRLASQLIGYGLGLAIIVPLAYWLAVWFMRVFPEPWPAWTWVAFASFAGSGVGQMIWQLWKQHLAVKELGRRVEQLEREAKEGE